MHNIHDQSVPTSKHETSILTQHAQQITLTLTIENFRRTLLAVICTGPATLIRDVYSWWECHSVCTDGCFLRWSHSLSILEKKRISKQTPIAHPASKPQRLTIILNSLYASIHCKAHKKTCHEYSCCCTCGSHFFQFLLEWGSIDVISQLYNYSLTKGNFPGYFLGDVQSWRPSNNWVSRTLPFPTENRWWVKAWWSRWQHPPRHNRKRRHWRPYLASYRQAIEGLVGHTKTKFCFWIWRWKVKLKLRVKVH